MQAVITTPSAPPTSPTSPPPTATTPATPTVRWLYSASSHDFAGALVGPRLEVYTSASHGMCSLIGTTERSLPGVQLRNVTSGGRQKSAPCYALSAGSGSSKIPEIVLTSLAIVVARSSP